MHPEAGDVLSWAAGDHSLPYVHVRKMGAAAPRLVGVLLLLGLAEAAGASTTRRRASELADFACGRAQEGLCML